MTDARVIPIDGSGEGRPLKVVKSAGSGKKAGSGKPAGSSKSAKPVKRKRPEPVPAAEPVTAAEPIKRKRPAAKRVPPKSKKPAQADRPADDAVSGSAARTASGSSAPGADGSLDAKVASVLSFLRRRITGDFEVDDFGYDAELTDKVLLAWLRPLYQHWFRVEIRGIENVPADGGALIVANHSGTIAIDSIMTQLALLDHHPQHRALRMLGADLVFSMPVVSEFARKSGATVACNADAERLLGRGEVVGVWPEGFKGVGKPFSERYKLQRFGRGGFVAAALRAKVPIIPVSIVGAEEIYPIIGNLKTWPGY